MSVNSINISHNATPPIRNSHSQIQKPAPQTRLELVRPKCIHFNTLQSNNSRMVWVFVIRGPVSNLRSCVFFGETNQNKWNEINSMKQIKFHAYFVAFPQLFQHLHPAPSPSGWTIKIVGLKSKPKPGEIVAWNWVKSNLLLFARKVVGNIVFMAGLGVWENRPQMCVFEWPGKEHKNLREQYNLERFFFVFTWRKKES